MSKPVHIGYKLKDESDKDYVDRLIFGEKLVYIPPGERVGDDQDYMHRSVPERTMTINDKGLYFIRGHIGGSLVMKAKELGILDTHFEPVYEDMGGFDKKDYEHESGHDKKVLQGKKNLLILLANSPQNALSDIDREVLRLLEKDDTIA